MQIIETKYEHYRFRESGYPNLANASSCNGRHGFAERYMRGVTEWMPSPRGGYTVCRILVNTKEIVGFAECSKEDSFCYRIGRRIALGRARKKYIQAKIVRTA